MQPFLSGPVLRVDRPLGRPALDDFGGLRHRFQRLMLYRFRGQPGHMRRLDQIEGERSRLLLERTLTEAQIGVIETARSRGGNREALLLMTGKSLDPAVSSGLGTIEERLFPLLLEEQLLLGRFGSRHPDVQTLRKKIELTRDFLLGRPADEERQDILDVYITSLSQRVASNKEQESKLTALFTQEQEAGRAISMFEVKDATYREEIQRVKTLFDAVVKRLGEINLVRDYGGYKMQVITPGSPGRQVEPVLSKIMGIAAVMGLVFGSILAIAVDIANRTFDGPDDLAQYLGKPILAHVPTISSRETKGVASGQEHAVGLGPTDSARAARRSRLWRGFVPSGGSSPASSWPIVPR